LNIIKLNKNNINIIIHNSGNKNKSLIFNLSNEKYNLKWLDDIENKNNYNYDYKEYFSNKYY
jgi:hypothetical protein